MYDEYAYAGLGLIHSNFIVPQIAKFNILDNLEVRQFYRLISLIILLGIFLYFYALNKIIKNNFLLKLIIIVFTILILRYLIYLFEEMNFPPASNIFNIFIFDINFWIV